MTTSKHPIDLMAIAAAAHRVWQAADDIREVMKEQARRDVEVEHAQHAHDLWEYEQRELLIALIKAGIPLAPSHLLLSSRDRHELPSPDFDFSVRLDPVTGKWV